MNILIRIFSIIMSFIMTFAGYPLSFLESNTDETFDIKKGQFSLESIFLNGSENSVSVSGYDSFDGQMTVSNKAVIEFEENDCGYFNYYAVAYSSDAYLKGVITYSEGRNTVSEDFFLEPSEDGEFFSFIDGILDKKKANEIILVSFEPLDKEIARISVSGVATFNRKIPDREVFIDNRRVRIGVDLLWGGALSYFEDLDSDVEAVRVDGRVKVDSDASERYGKRAFSKNVNLINRFDPGRLVQQSYYGTNGSSGDGYVQGEFMGNLWNYNPVQGGNQFGESSKIVDLRVTDNVLYVKCRPLDWALPKENITPSYMEATYTLDGNLMNAECRFVDYSGYTPYYTSQEIPAFYCIEPLNRFVYYGGENPWSDETLTVEPDLIFWPDAGYPKFESPENWSAFIGEFDDSFGIGVYVPDETTFLAGVFDRGGLLEKDPSKGGSTSYIAVIKFRTFESYAPYSYQFSLASGNTAEIRDAFSEID